MRWCPLYLLPALALLADPSEAVAQSALSWLTIRQNVQAKTDTAQPAFFTVVLPSGQRRVINTGVGLIAKVVDRPLITLGPSLEYLRNTDLQKPVDSLKLGAALEWQMREVSARGSTNSPILLGAANYKRDGVKDTRGLEASALYTHVFVGEGRAPLPNRQFVPLPSTPVVYTPYAGLEVEQAGGDTSGHVLRTVLRADVVVYPVGQRIHNRVEFTGSAAYRRDFEKTLIYPGRNHALYQAGATLYLLRESKRMAGVGVTYVSGEDPSKGFEKQSVWQFGLRIQFK